MKSRLNKIFCLLSGVMILSLIPLSQSISYSSQEAPQIVYDISVDDTVSEVIQISSSPESAQVVESDNIITTDFTDTENPVIKINTPVQETEPVQVETEPEPELINLGKYRLTAYCSCSKCCGNWSKYNKTESGTTPKQRRTVAVDKKKIPVGSHLIINGHEYVAEDTGSGVNGKSIDIYFSSHRDALNFGVQHATVYLVK